MGRGENQLDNRFDDPQPPDFEEASEQELRVWLESLGFNKLTQRKIITLIMLEREARNQSLSQD